ncbi:MAG: electron transfer flavoprotein subunit beta/FixA family protein [Gammaproteobacteria bacterium]|jgi:electron transfer flavoprotein beta subunit|nr:EtfB protein [Chromatiales bacterium]MCP4926089.1 electron transfer flavoprotein subunit beta/FixA family protein [Gammaproteobacteria bacterium]MDP7154290.1 electron transfer flavoprotein subunit beta/FixA family protein [Gammaproteobacteria bacterium]MDP7296530.1 electron transfer flavoprotein subunit beta/FixA family protein [Gammaproteobacteria bacterium]MDP7419445.1 electron transfer flavoprotein subunit beta/FixA family protein [Gammaproteobacteria bacterium]
MDKVMVCLKRVVDYNVRIRVKPDQSGVVTEGVKMSVNPFDEIALEEALRLREQGKASEVLAVSIGSSDCQQQLRTSLAMGADRAILVETDHDIESLAAAQVLLKLVETESPDLVLLGKQAIDNDCNQTAQMLAALWDRPQATFASEIEISDETLRITREVDAGLEVIDVDLPAVVSTDLRLNEPRYVKLPDIMKAKRKPIEVIPIDDMGIDTTPMFTVSDYAAPPVRSKGQMVDDVAGLVGALKEKGFSL